MTPIKFGTDGWRAIIAEDYTFENLTRVALGTARWIKAQQPDARVAVGYDTRFLGRTFAELTARVFATEGLEVLLSTTFVPTPALSWATLHEGCAIGIAITASHNPPEYNGFKIKASFGGPAFPEDVTAAEAVINALPAEAPPLISLQDARDRGLVRDLDIRSGFLNLLRERLDIDAIRARGLRIAHDAMYGAGQGYLPDLLDPAQVVQVRCDLNPGFHGQAPEPIDRNLAPLVEAVLQQQCAVGLANDGDADRIGMVDELGQWVSSHLILALLVQYLHEDQGLTGTIVKTFSTTHMLDRMADALGLPLETTPIGFKYIAPKIVAGNVLVGGEESGGIAVQTHLPERDGLFIGLLIVEMMVKRGKKLSELVADLYATYGNHAYDRVDVHLMPAQKSKIQSTLQAGGLREIAGHAVLHVDPMDGYKHLFADRWLLIRPSGTEPVLRIYAEAPTLEEARALLEDAMGKLEIRN